MTLKKPIIIASIILSATLPFLYYASITAVKETSNNIKSKATVMTYNVENLFDTKNDPKKNDDTYLPLKTKKTNLRHKKKCKSLKSRSWQYECLNLDWNEKVLRSKMKRLADVILKSKDWIGPDILILQEVENLEVLEALRLRYLKKYYPKPAILLEGPDRRGIDVAILTKFKSLVPPKLHQLDFKTEGSLTKSRLPVTRGILEVTLELPDKTPITVFGVHFPSQGTPTPARKQALNQLVNLIKDKPKNHLVVAGGDFNITNYESNKEKYFSNLKDQFLVSHLVGCKNCRGTNYFHPRKSWSFLDVIIFSNNFKSKDASWTLDLSSIRVFNQSLYQNNKWGSPMKFQLGKHQQGVSDHWPLLADIVLNSSRSKGMRR